MLTGALFTPLLLFLSIAKVYDLSDFYVSGSFTADGFEADHQRRLIVRKF